MKRLALLLTLACSVSAFADAQYSQCTFKIKGNDTNIDSLENSRIKVKFDLDKGESIDQDINLKRVIVFEKDINRKKEVSLEKTDDLIVMFDSPQTDQAVKKITTEFDEDLIGDSITLSNNLSIRATRSDSNNRKVTIRIRNNAQRANYNVRLSGIGAEVYGSIKVPFSYTGTKGILWAKKDAQKDKMQKISFECRITEAPQDELDEIDASNDSEDVKAEKALLKKMSKSVAE